MRGTMTLSLRLASFCAILLAVALSTLPRDGANGRIGVASALASAPGAAPRVRVIGSVQRATVRVGQAEVLRASVWAGRDVGPVIVDFEILDFRGDKVYERTRITLLRARPPHIVTLRFTPTNKDFTGTYYLAIGVFGRSWKPMYVWDNSAASFEVRGVTLPHVTARVRVTPRLVSRGSAVRLSDTLSVKKRGVRNVLADFEIYGASGKVFQKTRTGISIPPFGTTRVSVSWKVPRSLPPGAYVLAVGVFGAGWSPLYLWKPKAAAVTVQ
jgi:hypothetical protein